MSERVEMIKKRLTEALAPTFLAIEDESHKHAGHASAQGGGHFNVFIVSPAFEGKTLIQRHRMIYEALGEAMKEEIHALSIKALSPQEAPKKGNLP
ncbi:MAG: BolA family transcriptional regulator [Gammaproteobacteria bacterium]|nr:MAG: BolA family transcriptional regulator [Gammaproteobacteria bacterium]